MKTQNGVTTLTQTNQYNGADQRIKKTETAGSNPVDVVNYFYQDGKVLYTTGSDANKAFNILGAGDNIIATEHQDTNGNASYSFYNKDLRGSTTNILGSDLTSKVSYDYDWFGNTEISNPQGSDFYNQICYTGGMYDESTKQYYLNARYYDPEDGRFISQDTYRGNLRDANSWNLYAYCANNPVKYSDPSGHFIQIAIAVGFAAWAVYDGVKEYKKAKKAGKTGSKLALHMGGYVAKDIIIGKALKAFKVADRIKDVATKVYKSKVVTKTFAAVKSKIQPRLPKLNVSNTSKLKSGSTLPKGFDSFNDAKKFLGSPGEGNQWHHIVEQSQIQKSGFRSQVIQSPDNLIAVDKAAHAKISGYYNTKSFDFTGGLSVRNWLAGQSYEKQYEFGKNVLKQFGVTK